MSALDPTWMGDRWTIVPDAALEAITYFAKLVTGGYSGSGIAVTEAERFPSENQVFSGGALITEITIDWGIWMDTAASAFTPRPGDRITDNASVNYVVLDVKRKYFGKYWRLMCRQEL